jgi:hypothetical protein
MDSKSNRDSPQTPFLLVDDSPTSRILRGFYDHPTTRVGDLEKLQADLHLACTIDKQQVSNILFRCGARTQPQDLDRHFERLPLLVQRRYLQFDPCDRGD